MKFIAKKLAFVLIFAYLISICSIGVYAASESNTNVDCRYYTALGDSIAFGYNVAQEDSYVSLFYNYLKTEHGFSSINLYNMSKNGYDSSDILEKLKNDEATINAVKKSDIVTICIGANNILSPVIEEVGKAAGIDTSSSNLADKLADMIKQNPASVFALAGTLQSDKLNAALTEGITRFSKDWPEIIDTVKTLSPRTQIFVMNVYNPLNKNDILYKTIDNPIQQINNIINMENPYYTVADVYTAFKNYDGTTPLTNFSIMQGAFDPHPTKDGHNIIYNLHCDTYKSVKEKSAQPIRRADAVSILVKALALKQDFENNFSDIEKESSCYNSVGIAKKLGIVAGKGQNKFYPDDEITREEAMAVIARAIHVTGKTLTRGSISDLSAFQDKSSVSSFAVESIATLYRNGIASFSRNKIEPKAKISYYEFMNMIYSIL